MKIISEIKIKVNGELCMAKVSDEGYAILPDGTQKKLSEQQFAIILEKIEKMTPTNEEARPLTLPDIVSSHVPENDDKKVEIQDTPQESKPEEDYNNQNIQPKITPLAPKEKNKPIKEPKPAKVKKEKQPGSFAATATILAAGIVIIMIMFFYATISGIISFNTNSDSEIVIPPESTSEPSPTPETSRKDATKEDLDEAQTILIVAHIVTPEGEEKEVVLGYFTTDDEEASSLPDVGVSKDNQEDADSSKPEKKTSSETNKPDMIYLKDVG